MIDCYARKLQQTYEHYIFFFGLGNQFIQVHGKK